MAETADLLWNLKLANNAGKGRAYLDTYAANFESFRDKPVRLLEIGVRTGGSLRMWRDYFPDGLIYGIDIRNPIPAENRLKAFRINQTDVPALTQMAGEVGPFDIIIDDASHVADKTAASFRCLFFHHLRDGGIYAIEDWGTGYWVGKDGGQLSHYHPKGDKAAVVGLQAGKIFPSHQHGMVGLVKQLVDETAGGDLRKPGHGDGSVASLHVQLGLVLVRRAGQLKWNWTRDQETSTGCL
jgi:hypothetical protein